VDRLIPVLLDVTDENINHKILRSEVGG
jgi:hypothetical protein